MSRASFILTSPAKRAEAKRAVDGAPALSTVEIKVNKRTLPQNDRLHAMLTQFAKQLVWHGQKLTVDDWKLVFMDALKREVRCVPNFDGNGFVNLGRSTAKLTKDEFTDLMTLVEAKAAEYGVDLKEPQTVTGSQPRSGEDTDRP